MHASVCWKAHRQFPIGVVGRIHKSLVHSFSHYIKLKVSHLRKHTFKELRGLGGNYVQLSFGGLIRDTIWPCGLFSWAI